MDVSKFGLSVVRSLTYCFVIFLFALVNVVPAKATLIDGSSCDSEFLDVIKARGWMQAKRELEVAQSTIVKPDSVLTYSCFDQRVTEAKNEIMSDGSITNGLVGAPLINYMTGNFEQNLAAGNFRDSNDDEFDPFLYPDDICGLMGVVWHGAQGSDWDGVHCENANEIRFISFETLTNSDYRSFPQGCNAAEPDHHNKWQAAVAATSPIPSNIMETVASYMPPTIDFLNVDDCKDPIPTGLIVNIAKPGVDDKQRPDRICAVPGCYYSWDDENLEGPGGCVQIPPDIP